MQFDKLSYTPHRSDGICTCIFGSNELRHHPDDVYMQSFAITTDLSPNNFRSTYCVKIDLLRIGKKLQVEPS